MAASSLECRAATARRYACTSHEDGASRVRAPGVLMPHAWGLLPLPAPLRRQLQVRLACHAACSAAVRHEVSRHCLLLSCTHVALTVLLSFICQVLQGREGARHQREIQEWPFPGVSLFRVLGRSRGACVRVCCVVRAAASRPVFRLAGACSWRMKMEGNRVVRMLAKIFFACGAGSLRRSWRASGARQP